VGIGEDYGPQTDTYAHVVKAKTNGNCRAWQEMFMTENASDGNGNTLLRPQGKEANFTNGERRIQRAECQVVAPIERNKIDGRSCGCNEPHGLPQADIIHDGCWKKYTHSTLI